MSEKTNLLLIGLVLGAVGCAAWKLRPSSSIAATRANSSATIAIATSLAPSPRLVTWPLLGAKRTKGPLGVVRFNWERDSGIDIDFMEFDFKANPRLHLQLFNQYAPTKKGLASIPTLNAADALALKSNNDGRVIAICNGGPFDDGIRNGRMKPDSQVIPTASVVEKNQIHRVPQEKASWIFGVRRVGEPRFDVVWQPESSGLNSFVDATSGVQCLIHEGHPLSIALPASNGKFSPFAKPSSADIGSVGERDWLKTSRVSIGWNRDGSKLWMVSLHSAQDEAKARFILSTRLKGQSVSGLSEIGWTARDVQDFWERQGAYNAVLLACGDYAQFANLRPDGKVSFVPPLQMNEAVDAKGNVYYTGEIPGLVKFVSKGVRETKAVFGRGGVASLPGGRAVSAASPFLYVGPNATASIKRERPQRYSRLICPPDSHVIPSGGAALSYWMVRETQ